MIRKVFLSIVAVFLSSQANSSDRVIIMSSRYQQGLAAAFVLGLALFLHVKFQPYEDDEVNTVELSGLSVGFISLYCGLWTFSINDNEASQTIVTYIVIGCNVVWALYTLRLLFKGLCLYAGVILLYLYD